MIRSAGSSRSASRRTAPGDRARRPHRRTPRPPAPRAGGRCARHGARLRDRVRSHRDVPCPRGRDLRTRDRRGGVRDLVGGRDGAARHLRRPRDRDPRAYRGPARVRGGLRLHGRRRERLPARAELSAAARESGGSGVPVRPRAREHDRCQPAPDRHRLVDGGVHRVVSAAQGGADRARPPLERDLAHPGPLDRARLPVGGNALLADPAAEELDHADRHGGPRVPVRRVHVARLTGPGGGTAPRRPGAIHRNVLGHDTSRLGDRAVPRCPEW